jgi:hypothetical protein
MTALDGWENFYVIIGSSAAALTGLMFVVITLTTEARVNTEGATAFSSPTVLHFCYVLLIAAIVSTPRHTPASLGICIGVASVAGLVYSIRIIARIRSQRVYKPVLEDWIWHAAFPLVAYTSLTAAALLYWQRPVIMLDIVAASTLLLLYTGIHNSWDAAMYLAAARRGEQPPD